jgi:hypothetical protein
LTERDRRTFRWTVLKNYGTAAAQVTGQQNWILILKIIKDSFHKICPTCCELRRSSINGRAAIAKPLITEVMLRCINYGAMTTKLGHQTTGNSCDVARWIVLHAVSCTRKSLRLKLLRTPTIQNAQFQQWNMGEVLWWFGHQYCGTVFSWFHYYPSWTHYCKGVWYMDRLGNQMQPVIQTLFPNSAAVFQNDNAPIHTPGTVQSWFGEN